MASPDPNVNRTGSETRTAPESWTVIGYLKALLSRSPIIGTDISTGAGDVDGGTQRVTLASDDVLVTLMENQYDTGASAMRTLAVDDTGNPLDTEATVPVYLRPNSSPWYYAAVTGGIVNTTTAVTIKAAAGASVRNYISALQIMSESLTNATELVIRDGAGGTVLWRMKIPATTVIPQMLVEFPLPIRSTADTLLEVATLTASGAGGVFVNAQGYSE